ncbi:pleckstrin homology domain-containing family G member 4B-like isoform X3 [Acipenser ruthenus]|uniref:pleckstrin homology domain-containing family G member 4B-like isoform X3 n=1 Tax=Acipenser ruthenus TaxID=7906 RepID=UPI0027404043|nr:pleckstrin homology domain-containing family G member 4B-like isoform X3 [Acipenser ruthenus]
MNQRGRTRSCDTFLSIKDSESLDTCIQNTLSALYPPFNATAATVLWQLFSVVEKLYRGDGLRCLIDFLLPAKRILQSIQQETCARFHGLIFYHEGWPLCIHEKVVVQLASLHKIKLKPGDFYIQIVPLGKQSVKLVLKCLSGNNQGIEEVLIPETMYGCIFTIEFLQNVTCGKNCSPLQNCLLTTGTVVYRTPWKNIVNPIFIATTESIMQNYKGNSIHNNLKKSSDNVTDTMENHSSQDSFTSEDTDSTVVEATLQDNHRNQGNNSPAEMLPKLETSPLTKDIDGDVHLENPVLATKGVDGVLSLANTEKGNELRENQLPSLKSDSRGGTRTLSFNTDLSHPGPARRQLRDSLYFETKRLFRKSYMEALQNPMHLGSSSEESITEATEQNAGQATKDISLNVSKNRTPDNCNQKRDSLPCSLPCRVQSGEAPYGHHCEASRPHTSQGTSLSEGFRLEYKRSKSLDRAHQNSQAKGHRARSSSGDSANRSPKRNLNGYALRLVKLDFEGAFSSSEKRPNCSKEDSDFLHPCTTEGAIRRNSGELCHTPNTPSRVSKCETALQQMLASDSEPSLPSQASEVNQELLLSRGVILPGNRDRYGHAVIQVCTRNKIWINENCTAKGLTRLIMYYYITLRKDQRGLGLTVLVDARRYPPVSVLFMAFTEIQALFPNILYSILMLVDKEAAFKPERDSVIQYEVLTSLKALHKHIDLNQLTQEFEGTFPYDHSQWIQFRRKIEPFASSCNVAIASLQSSITTLHSSSTLNTVQEVVDLINKQKSLMKYVLDDTRLVRLRLEGGTILARLKKEEFCDTEDYRDSIEMVTALYNQVDEEVHKLVILSNKSLQQLESLLELRKFEEGCDQIKLWFKTEGEAHLAPLDSLSFDSLKQMQQRFSVFHEEFGHHYKQGLCLIKDSKSINSCSLFDAVHLEEKVQNYQQFLNTILSKIEKRKNELEILVNLYEFYDTANQWMEHCNDYCNQLNVDNSSCLFSPTVVQTLQNYHREATKFSPDNYRRLDEMVLNLNSAKETKQWNTHWLKCQNTRRCLEEVLSKVTTVPKDCKGGTASRMSSDASPRTSGEYNCEGLREPSFTHVNDNRIYPGQMNVESNVMFEHEDINQNSNVFSENTPLFPQSFSSESERFTKSVSVFDDTDSDCTLDSSSASCRSEPISSPAARHRKQPLKKIMKKTFTYDMSQRESSHMETNHNGYTRVYIKGLEVVNNVAAEKKIQRPDIQSPQLGRSRSLSSPPRMHCRHSDEGKKLNSSKVQHIMDEMISTEREYVRSLGYIIENYFPEMERMDLPQDLRGKRNIIFGNLEKLYDFHSQYFLKDLEHCVDCPLFVSSCFLRHEEQFGMYALYSKNKPQSDTLLASHGNSFFKNKQLELGDKMDLASYLLKPIQRMSKYALLLKDMIKDCSKSQEQELSDLQAAEEMVKFQLRHGNDLLAMDAIRGCDVNLKEQGQLRCQDEFIVWCGRRKNLRHVFLFEDLILFSKTKKIDGGYDVYIYKQSYKTAEIGMTENVGDSGLRFEIWFRRRKSQDTFILQASASEVKAAWTNIIGKILWRQALRNRELRMQEMVSMGIGSKPFMDIKPSAAAISDRAIDYIMKGTESRTRASIAVSSFDHSTPFKRPHSTISSSSTSSSSSQSSSSILGSLNLHTYPSPTFNHWSYDIGTCIEEDELEQETGSQPSMITESSETSSQCTSSESMSGLSHLAPNCHSQLPIETFSDEGASYLCSQPPSQSTSPALFQKNTDLKQPTNQYITASKTTNIAIGLSTVV